MCTVTFVGGDQKIITSNRDEQVGRPGAIAPQTYRLGNKEVTYPKDPKGGGTWFVADRNGNVLVLLNGASEKHEFRDDWRKSRGLILLELAESDSFPDAWNSINLENIEPFTIVAYTSAELWQCRWDGTVKERLRVDEQKNHIWSSAPLYTKDIRAFREKMFADYMKDKTIDDIFNFHLRENDNQDESIVIDRGFLKTLSVTQARISNREISMSYFDLESKTMSELSFSIQ